MIIFERKKCRKYWFLLRYRNLIDETGVFIAKKSKIKLGTIIGSGTRINGKIVIKGSGKAELGKYCAIGEDVKIITSNHDTSELNLQYALQRKIGLKVNPIPENVIIGNNVWIGDSVIILSGVTIGNGAVLAAGSVVTKSIEPYTIVGGVPAKFIKSRFTQDKIDEIEKLKWWDWSIQKMKENKHVFLKAEDKTT